MFLKESRSHIKRGGGCLNYCWRAFLLNGIYFLVGVECFCIAFQSAKTADFFFNRANKSVKTYCLFQKPQIFLAFVSSNRMGMKNMKKRYVVIMAGGRGEGLPQSHLKSLKHFASHCGKTPMLAQTVDRLRGLVQPPEVFVITNGEQGMLF